ncbi:NAD(P)-binding domain-containing protein [Actinorhabdospora filicis]|nr:NAD(P)-binding domain-containing protein [Actinorhabdospora filicis]
MSSEPRPVAAELDAVVIGAGQAGLSSSYFLRRAGIEHVVFDHNPAPGGAWQHRWDSLTVANTHGVYDLPGLPLDFGHLDPALHANSAIPAYFGDYEHRFELPIRRPVSVTAVREHGDGRLLVETSAGDYVTRALVNATGTWEKPFWPHYPGLGSFRGRMIHSAGYTSAAEFAGKKVVVVGGGASALQHLLEISEVAATTWVTRREPVFSTEEFSEERGRMAVAKVDARVRAGLPPESVISVTGYSLTPTIKAAMERGILDRLPMFDRITPDGVAWDDGRFVPADAIVWATGFRASLDHLAPLKLREPGGGIRMDGTRVAADARVHLVGYGPSASTVGANRAGRAAVKEIRALLANVN